MATSGSVNFDQTRNEIINDALILCGAIEAGDVSVASEDTDYAARQLNRMVKAWQADGIRLWTRRQAYLFLDKSQGKYTLGPNSTDHAAELDDAVNTELSAAAASGASVISVDSVTGIAVSDNIGVVLDDDTIDWDTVLSISSLDITLTGTLSGAAAIDQPVFAYTTKIGRPLRIIEVARTSKDDLDVPIAMISDNEYQRLPNKTIIGKTNECYYTPERPDGFLYAWPEPETAADRLRLTCIFQIEDFDTSAHNPDLPQEWLDCLVWNLARKLCVSYGVPGDLRNEIRLEAALLYEAVSGWDRDAEGTSFIPDMTWGT